MKNLFGVTNRAIGQGIHLHANTVDAMIQKRAPIEPYSDRLEIYFESLRAAKIAELEKQIEFYKSFKTQC